MSKQSKKFDKSKPHQHFCERCKDVIYCSDTLCPYPKWTECADCLEGWSLINKEGSILKRKLVPLNNKIEPYFPEEK